MYHIVPIVMVFHNICLPFSYTTPWRWYICCFHHPFLTAEGQVAICPTIATMSLAPEPGQDWPMVTITAHWRVWQHIRQPFDSLLGSHLVACWCWPLSPPHAEHGQYASWEVADHCPAWENRMWWPSGDRCCHLLKVFAPRAGERVIVLFLILLLNFLMATLEGITACCYQRIISEAQSFEGDSFVF